MVEKSMKHIMIVHDIIPKLFCEYLDNWRKKIYWKMTEKGIKKADKIIAVSKCTEKDLIQQLGISPDKITTSYIDVDELFASRTGTIPPSGTGHTNILKKYKLTPGYILAGGGYEKRKNIEGVVRAYKILLDRNKKEHFLQEFPKLVIYGKILPKNLSLATDAEKLLKELNLTTSVKLLDLVPQKDLPAIFQNASLFVYPSLYEGFGMPVLEAMSTGTPVVTSKISSLPEVGGDSVLYCDPNDTRDIAMVLKNVLTNHDLRETLKNRGCERAKQFSWGVFCEKILNITREV
jgi:glycosyltransferase involved in cell wall biosynthesis